jgi:uncharacterized protein
MDKTIRYARRFASKAYGYRFVALFIAGIATVLAFSDTINRFIISLMYGDGIDTLAVQLQDVLTLSISILVEATPFLVLGTLIAIIVRLFVPGNVFTALSSLHPAIRRITLSLSGIFLPVCECGNVPVARSLMIKGFNPGDAIAFLLAAPIINPIVFIVTWQAFSYDSVIVWGRFLGAFIVAHLTALIVVRLLRNRNILTPDFAASCAHEHDEPRSAANAGQMFIGELWPLLRLLIVGAVIAALIQVFVSREVLTAVGSDPLLGVLAMIALGFVISICSSIDAFFALAFARQFQSGSLMAFMISGPMVDIKMIALMKTTFTVRAIALISLCVIMMSIAIGYSVNMVGNS